MNMNRRQWLHAGACSSLGLAWPHMASAQSEFPSRPITFVVPFTAGGGGDMVARLMAKHLGERLKTAVVVENKAGAGGTIGSAHVLRSPPDGYTLLNMSSSYAMQAATTNVPFDPVRDVQPLVMVSRDPGVILVNANSKLRNGKDLYQAAKQNPGRLTYGSAGIGTIAHLGMEALAFHMGVQMQHVPYKGSSQAFNDLLSGSIDLMLTTSTYGASFVKSGRVHALGICGSERTDVLPQVPTFVEQGWPDYVLYDWKAIAGPAGIPPQVVQTLNKAMNDVLALDAVKEKFRADGVAIVGGSPDVLAKTLRDEIGAWKALVKRANVVVQ
ncbi:Bug family tripartite tricarboxylate transporter substrate binding protein [Ottowia thiooxydans]|uniref:Bug family tripartite tricarboxylate transporter substrate binding protein n=1 Tax=Ottowia thiooxydans TaxID=219182 RepID=UPI00041F5E69|nr:tripartite tricarboxylate transporter substrate binding protein [Ottowia thiooxydans]